MTEGTNHHILHINPTNARARRKLCKGILRTTMKRVLARNPPVRFQRAWTKAILKSVAKPSSVTIDTRQIGGRTVHVLTPTGADDAGRAIFSPTIHAVGNIRCIAADLGDAVAQHRIDRVVVDVV